jgi:biopolymer transport protein ExbB/TolQ
MKRLLLTVLLAGTSLWAQNGAAATAATKAQRAELAQTQRLRDSIVALRWDARRLAQAEKDAWQDEFERVRDSLERIRDERSGLDGEARRVIREELAQQAEPASPTAADPLDPLRKQVLDRLRVLRERVAQGLPVGREQELAGVDSLLAQATAGASAEQTLDWTVKAWHQRLLGARQVVRLDTVLPRPEGEALKGTILRVGDAGAWYASVDGSVAGILVRSNDGGEPWVWREGLVDSAQRAIVAAVSGKGEILPVDPGVGVVDGDGFFVASSQESFGQKMSKLFSFQDGPLHLLALWAARAVMALLVFLGALVAWIGWQRHRALLAHEADAGRYENQILNAMRNEAAGQALRQTCAPTVAGRAIQAGLDARDLPPEALEQVLTAFESAEVRHLEKDLGLLGTIGSNAPFIGLFGTVCGILDAFAALGRAGGGTQAVMTAIAEALIATAIGLLVAIPAIWLFNSLTQRVQEIGARVRDLRTLMVAASLEAAVRGTVEKP